MSFGARLTAARKKKQLTQDGLGKGLGTDGKDASKAVVYGWEKDQHFPRVDQLVLICEKLGCSSDYLLFGTEAASGLSTEVAQLAAAIDQLQGKQRDWVLMTIRTALDLARESMEGAPLTQKTEPATGASISTSSKRTRAA